VHGTEIQDAYSNQVIPFLLGSREKSLEIKLDPELSEKKFCVTLYINGTIETR
jgi:hypothetical protein